MSFKKRIAGSVWANRLSANLFYGYIRLCHLTTRWKREGFDEMEALVEQGQPVLVLVWHERLFMSTYLFDSSLGPVSAITTNSRMAYLGKFTLEHFDYDSVMVDPKKSSNALSRQIFRKIRKGESIVISPDGTRGPPRVAKSFPVSWARSAQIPVFCTAYAIRRSLRLPTWDRAHIPLPFNRGAFLARRWEGEVPRDADDDQLEAFRSDMNELLNAVTDDADRMVGRSPEPRSSSPSPKN
ncbi:MAG: DUF374 domain-containing protein [Pseudomonadota bacterium]